MHIRSSAAYFQKVTHNVLAMPTQFLTTADTQCLYVYCITIWHKSKMWSQSHLRKRSTQLALLPRQGWVHPYTNSNAIVKHFHGHSLASSPHMLGKEGPKQMRRVTVRKFSTSLKSDTIVPSLPIEQDLKNRNRIKRSYNANSYHIPFKNMSFIMKKS